MSEQKIPAVARTFRFNLFFNLKFTPIRDAQLIENLKALDIYPALTLDVMEEIDVIMGNTPVMDEY